MLPRNTSEASLWRAASLGWKVANTPRRVSSDSRDDRSSEYLPAQWKVSPVLRSMPVASMPAAVISSR